VSVTAPISGVRRLTKCRFYYQYKPERLPCMTLTVHALLHVANTIETIGPVWTWWPFPIERQCGRFQRKVKSRKHPYTNLDNYLLQHAQLDQIKMIYNLSAADLSIGERLTQRKRVELVLQNNCVPSPLFVDCKHMLITLSRQRNHFAWPGQAQGQAFAS
jgi:hypothetical protein